MNEKERIERFLESINEDNVRVFFNTLIEMCNIEEMIKEETYNKYKIDTMIEDDVDKITKDVELAIRYEMITDYITYKPICKMLNTYYIFTDNGWSYGCEITKNYWRYFIEMIIPPERFKARDILLIQRTFLDEIKRWRLSYDAIQLIDSYIQNGKVFEGFYGEAIPRLNISHKITDDVDCKVALDLINHLCNGDEKVANCLLDEIASALILDKKFKERNGRILRLYGREETGKSVFTRFLKKVFNTSNCSSMELNKLGTDNYYEAGRVADSIFVIDEYGNDIPYKESVLRILRLVILGQRIKVRQPYKPFEEVSPICKIIVTSYYPFSDDRMESLKRRTYQIEIKNKLERPDEWFNQLFSEKEYQAFFNLCIKRMETIMNDFNNGIYDRKY